MLKIYGADLSSPANKVRFVANALNLQFEYIRVSIRDGENKKEDFLRLHPAGKIPVIVDDGFILFESGAIVKYLCEKHPSGLYPADLKQRAIVNQWTDFSTLHIGTAMGRVFYNRVIAPMTKAKVDEQSLSDGLTFLSRFLPIIDKQLSLQKYLAQDKLTLADITLLAALDPAEVSGVELNSYQNIVKWRDALKKQDFYTKCFQEYGEILKARK